MAVPEFSHIVVAVEENHDYSQIIGSPQAPYINSLASGGALLTNYDALTHPSEPNYFALYAGSTFGISADVQISEPDPTLDTILNAAGKTFAGYVDNSTQSSEFDHDPWESFPAGFSVEKYFTTFPIGNFASLPTVSFVIPNADHDMHNGNIQEGDTWLRDNLSSYAQWAKSNNSLLIVTWDENDGTEDGNHVATILYGADVKTGTYPTAYNHYNLLSTLLASYGLTGPRNAATASPIDVFQTVCFAAGTHIRTRNSEKVVESLMPGDIVTTLAGGQLTAQPVKWIGRRRIDLLAHLRPEMAAPVQIRRGAFAENVPHTDLLLSPDHAIFVDGKLICARQLINGTTIRQEEDLPSIEYFHVELDSHAILIAEGLPVESYLDTGNRGFFANSDEPLVLHPDLTQNADCPTRGAGACAPFVCDEANVRPAWQRLADRAAAIGLPVPQSAITTDPDLQLVADQRGIRPVFSDSNLVTFVLPDRAKEVWLLSRAQSPTEARPWLEERRRIGIRVKRIVLRGADELREIPMDHPDLTKGWWYIERDGQAMSRWTNGDAIIPLPAMDGHVVLELHLAGEMIYAVETELGSQAERRAA